MESVNNKPIAKAVAKEIKRLVGARKKLNFVLVGRTGAGKSITINSLLGADIAPTGKYRPTTLEVSTYSHSRDGINYTVVDTPGLCDDLPDAGNDDEYINRIKSQVAEVDSLWYVCHLDETRLTGDERRGIKLISEAFSPGVWRNAVIVFTRADKVDKDEFDEDLKERTAILRDEIGKYAPSEARNIPSVAVSNKGDALRNGDEWIGELFTVVFTRFSDAGAVPFIASLKDDINPGTTKEDSKGGAPRIQLSEAQQKRVRDSEIEALYGADDTFNDVRSYIDENIVDDAVEMTVGNHTLGGDPIFGVPKTLYIRYQNASGEYEATLQEGEALRIPDSNHTQL